MHAGVAPDAATGGILTPIHQSTTFVQESIDAGVAQGRQLLAQESACALTNTCLVLHVLMDVRQYGCHAYVHISCWGELTTHVAAPVRVSLKS